MDRSIEEIIVYWRKALAGGYHDSRLNASETGKLISEIERRGDVLEEIKGMIYSHYIDSHDPPQSMFDDIYRIIEEAQKEN